MERRKFTREFKLEAVRLIKVSTVVASDQKPMSMPAFESAMARAFIQTELAPEFCTGR